MYDYIVLIRRKPSSARAMELDEALRAAFRTHQSSLVFLHGDGVGAACDAAFGTAVEDSGIDWCVCQTSLVRRSDHVVVPPAFRAATLVTLLDEVLTARRVDSLGLGGRFCCRPDAGDAGCEGLKHLLMEVGFAPADQRQRRETLEMALAAAALELNASVLFHGDGLAHLAGDEARGWRQISDFGLLAMYVEDPVLGFVPDIAVQNLDAGRAAGMRAGATTILTL